MSEQPSENVRIDPEDWRAFIGEFFRRTFEHIPEDQHAEAARAFASALDEARLPLAKPGDPVLPSEEVQELMRTALKSVIAEARRDLGE